MNVKVYKFPDNYIEVIYSPGSKVNKHNIKNKYNNEEYKKYRFDYIKKRISYLRKFIKQNPGFFKSFVTLTFENQNQASELKYCLNEFRKFYKRVKFFYKNFSYIMVPEYTQNNVIHFHLLTNLDLSKYSKYDKRVDLNNDNFVDKYHAFGDFWRYGFINVKKIQDNNKVLNYILKYIFKNNITKRVYYSSYDIKLNILKLKVPSFNFVESLFSKITLYIEKSYYVIIGGFKSDFLQWVEWSNSLVS